MDLLPLAEVDSSALYPIVHDNLEVLLSKSFLPDLLKRLEDADLQRICDKLLYDIDRVNAEVKYVQAIKLIKLSKTLGESLRRKVCERLLESAVPYFRIKLWYYGHVDLLDEEALRECYFRIDEMGLNLNPKGVEKVESRFTSASFGARNSEEGNLTRAKLSKKVAPTVLHSLFLRTIVDGEKIGDIGLDINRIDTEDKYVKATELVMLSKPLGETLWRKVSERLSAVAIPYYRIKLWYYGHLDALDEESLRECYFKIDDLGVNLNPTDPKESESNYSQSSFGTMHSEEGNLTRELLSKRVNSEVLYSLFLNTIVKCERLIDIGQEPYSEILRACIGWEGDQRKTLTDAIWEKGGNPVRLQLWLAGHSDRFDYGAFKILFLTLKAEEQFRFVRKLFQEAELKRFDLSVAQLDELARFDEEFAAEFDLDYSIDIALKALSDLASGRALSEERNLGRVLVRHFNRKAFKKYQISGLFDECEGRCYVSSDGANAQPQVKLRRSHDQPQGVNFCEGRLAPQLDHTHGLKFWWCRNAPCFTPSHMNHGTEEWEKYTVRDMLRILQVPYDSEEIQVFQGMVNRVNVLLLHLNCRSCDRIMTPKGQSNFGFYRASRFVCANDDCANKEEVYLNHCLNGKCQTIVDSRDSAKCPNGLYICTNCCSCCSTKSFARRIENLKQVGQNVPESLQILVEQNLGHAEQGRKFCYCCGTELAGGTEGYRRALKWLMDNREFDERIKASGQRPSDRGWWFIVVFPEEKYESLSELGFEIQPTKRGNGRMVSTPHGGKEHTLGKCPNDSCKRFGISC